MALIKMTCPRCQNPNAIKESDFALSIVCSSCGLVNSDGEQLTGPVYGTSFWNFHGVQTQAQIIESKKALDKS